MASQARPRGVFEDRLTSLDVTLFQPIGLPGWRADPRSLLALHAAARAVHGTFAYLEIGSYLGSSLQVAIADPRCTSVVSIDLRPARTPDDRWHALEFPDNSTAHMLELLRTVPGAQLEKLRTFDVAAADVDPSEIPQAPNLCFIDGEHT